MSDSIERTEAAKGSDLLSRLSNEMVRMQKRFYGRGPTQAKSYMLDDLLVIVMRGGTTTAERTMLDFDRPDVVRAFRQEWQNVMTEHLVGMVQDVTGRRVVTYQSQVMFDPDTVVEFFVFDRPAPDAAVYASAAAQLADRDDAGTATDTRALDRAAEPRR